MWTPTTRRQHSRPITRYQTDLTDAEWRIVAPHLPKLHSRSLSIGRPNGRADVDCGNAPCWRPEWIDPDYIFAELVGRILIAINSVPPDERPAEWVGLVDAAIAELTASGLLLVTQFAGPFDDIRPSATPKSSAIDAFSDVEAKLETATQLDDMPVLSALASASQPSENVVANVRRITTRPVDEPLTRGELRIAASISASARDSDIGDGVINRCLNLARQPDRRDGIR
jgi:hypothetical protein